MPCTCYDQFGNRHRDDNCQVHAWVYRSIDETRKRKPVELVNENPRMQIDITITDVDLKQMILQRLKHQMPEQDFELPDIKIETKSQQNYKAEWEAGAGFRARITKHTK